MTDRMPSACAARLIDADFCAFTGDSGQRRKRLGEKRSSVRFAHEEPIILETDSGELIGAVVINYGQSGLYFESDFKTEQGAVLRIRNESALARHCRGVCEAQVRWTQKIDNANNDYTYGTGVQYC